MIFYSQLFFKQPPQFHRPKVYIAYPVIYLLQPYVQSRTRLTDCHPLTIPLFLFTSLVSKCDG